MPHFLAYWQEYDPETDEGEIDWASNSKWLFEAVGVGDTIWGVVNLTDGDRSEWRLLEKVVISRKRPLRVKDWRYYFEANRNQSLRFHTDDQPDFTPMLWLLDFKSGKKLRLKNNLIGRALQSHGGRQLAHRDVALLEEYADALRAIGLVAV